MLRRFRAGSFAAAVRSTIESRPPETARIAWLQLSSADSTAPSTSEASTPAMAMILLIYLFTGEFRLETHGPLGTLWVSIGLIAFYFALIWLNSLLGLFLTPLFMIPGTWLLDWRKRRKGALGEKDKPERAYQG